MGLRAISRARGPGRAAPKKGLSLPVASPCDRAGQPGLSGGGDGRPDGAGFDIAGGYRLHHLYTSTGPAAGGPKIVRG